MGSPDVRLTDGLEIKTDRFGMVTVDHRIPSGDTNFCTHAHGDHLPTRKIDEPVLASSLTSRLAAARDCPGGFASTLPTGIRFCNAGHIEGSRSIIIEDADRRILVTGDIAVRDRLGLDGFEPVPADILVIEATYGSGAYTFPSIDTVRHRVQAWLETNRDSGSPSVLFGYPLGKAQRLQHLLASLRAGEVITTEAVRRMNRVITSRTDYSFRTTLIDRDDEVPPEAVFLLPTHLAGSAWVESYLQEIEAATAAFSGWAVADSYRYRLGVDRGFVLSDHCDFDELVSVVDSVDPAIVYTHHGAASEIATTLTHRGHRARALKQNQTSLQSF